MTDHKELHDYAEPVVKALELIKKIEHLLRLRRFQEAMDSIANLETQCCKLRNYAYRESENGKD